MAINDFVKTFMEVEALKNQQRQIAVLEDNANISRLNSAMDAAAMLIDPEAQRMLAFAFGGDDQLQQYLAQILPQTAPAPGVLAGIGAARGYQSMTPEARQNIEQFGATQEIAGVSPGTMEGDSVLQTIARNAQTIPPEELLDVARGYASRLGAGMGPGQLQRELTVADLSPEDLQAMTYIEGGLSLSEAQKVQMAQFASRLNFDMMDLAQRGEIAMAQLEIQRRSAAGGGSGGAGGASANTLITTLTDMLEVYGNPEKNPTERAVAAQVYNNTLRLLTEMGLFSGAAYVDPDPRNMDSNARTARNILYGAGAGAIAGGLVGGIPGAVIGAGVGGMGGVGWNAATTPVISQELLSNQQGNASVDLNRLLQLYQEELANQQGTP